jgi:predicted N-acyltransferase
MSRTVTIIDSISRVDRGAWDSLFTDPLLSHDWLRFIESARPIRVIPRHLVLYSGGQVVAALPCYLQHDEMYTTVEDRLFGRFRPWARRLGIRTLPALVANVPLSYRGGVGIAAGQEGREVVRELLSGMEEAARKEGVNLYGFSYLPSDPGPLEAALLASGFSTSLVVPTTFLDITWADFEDYVRDLTKRHKKTGAAIRRQINRNRKAGVTIVRVTDFAPLCEDFARLFDQTYRRYTGRASPLKPDFFRTLSSHCPGRAVAYCGFKEGRLRGYFLVLKGEKIWHGILTGQEYVEEEKDFTFFNVTFYEPLRDAIAEGARRVYFGAASYEAKMRRGCRSEPLFMWLRSPGSGGNRWLRSWLALTELRYRHKHRGLLSLHSPPSAGTGGGRG